MYGLYPYTLRGLSIRAMPALPVILSSDRAEHQAQTRRVEILGCPDSLPPCIQVFVHVAFPV